MLWRTAPKGSEVKLVLFVRYGEISITDMGCRKIVLLLVLP